MAGATNRAMKAAGIPKATQSVIRVNSGGAHTLKSAIAVAAALTGTHPRQGPRAHRGEGRQGRDEDGQERGERCQCRRACREARRSAGGLRARQCGLG